MTTSEVIVLAADIDDAIDHGLNNPRPDRSTTYVWPGPRMHLASVRFYDSAEYTPMSESHFEFHRCFTACRMRVKVSAAR